MKNFVVMLQAVDGLPGRDASAEAQVEFLAKLYGEGTLVVAGPFGDGSGGVAVLRSESLEQARDIYEGSPIVRSGRATADIREWNVVWGSLP